jgi:hypothetical protein
VVPAERASLGKAPLKLKHRQMSLAVPGTGCIVRQTKATGFTHFVPRTVDRWAATITDALVTAANVPDGMSETGGAGLAASAVGLDAGRVGVPNANGPAEDTFFGGAGQLRPLQPKGDAAVARALVRRSAGCPSALRGQDGPYAESEQDGCRRSKTDPQFV